MEPIFEIIPDRWVLVPTVLVGHPKCPCCDEGPVILTVDWLCFSAGVVINPPHHQP